jgi:hypothetical protein
MLQHRKSFGRGSAGDDRQKLHEKDDYPISPAM